MERDYELGEKVNPKITKLIEEASKKVLKKFDIEDVQDARTTFLYNWISRTNRLITNSTIDTLSRKVKSNEFYRLY
jgi:hypothetical protein